MKCEKCPYYNTGYMSNRCSLFGDENFMTIDDCDCVNDDGTINKEGKDVKYIDIELYKMNCGCDKVEECKTAIEIANVCERCRMEKDVCRYI